MKTYKKHIKAAAILLLAASLLSLFPICASAREAPSIDNIGAAYLYCVEADAELFEYESDKKIYPASTVKIMTGILALEYYKDKMDEVITVIPSVVNSTSGTHIGLIGREQLTAKDLISALIVGNANDAALVLAYEIGGGSIDRFVAEMNKKAEEIGAVSTHFTNPTGIHDDAQVSTAKDITKIAHYAYVNTPYSSIASIQRYHIDKTNKQDERYIHNKNYMISKWINLDYFDPEVNGLNAGSTNEAGYCLCATKYKGGMTYICTVMGAEYDEDEDIFYSYKRAEEMFDFGMSNFEYKEIPNKSDIICELPVTMSSKTDHVIIVPENTASVYLPKDTDINNEIKTEVVLDFESLTAPVAEGQRVGIMTVTYRDKIVGKISLVTKTGVDGDTYLVVLSKIRSVLSSFWFRLFVIIAFLLAAAYVLAVARLRYLKKREIKYSSTSYFDNYRKSEQMRREKEKAEALKRERARAGAQSARQNAPKTENRAGQNRDPEIHNIKNRQGRKTL